MSKQQNTDPRYRTGEARGNPQVKAMRKGQPAKAARPKVEGSDADSRYRRQVGAAKKTWYGTKVWPVSGQTGRFTKSPR